MPARCFVFLALLFLGARMLPTMAQPREGAGLPSPVAGDPTPRFDRLGLDDGLSQGSVFDILQDEQGFLWFATEDGLNRYDGYEFTVYKTVPFDSASLSDNTIQTLYEDRNGTLWIGTPEGGLNRMNRRTGTFTHYRHDPSDSTTLSSDQVTAIEEDSEGRLWLGTDRGVNRLDPATGHVTRFQHDPADSTSLSNDQVHGIEEDEQGNLWIATINGLNRFDPATGTFEQFLVYEGDLNTFNLERVGAVAMRFIQPDPGDPDVLWVSGYGLVRLNTATGEHERFLPNEQHGQDNVLFDGVTDPSATGVYWLTSNGGGLQRFDTRTKTFTAYRHDPNDPHSPVSDNLFSIHADRSGTIWAGAQLAQGLTHFDPTAGTFALYHHQPGNPNSLAPYPVWSVYEAPSEPGVLWVGTGGDQNTGGGVLNRIDRTTGTVTHFTFDPNDPRSLAPGPVWSILEDRDGGLWVGTGAALNRMDRASGRFTRFVNQKDDTTSLANNGTRTLFEDRDGTLWVGTFGGLHKMDRAAETFTRYRHDPNDSTSLSGNNIRAITQSHDGMLWIGTTSGLNRLDPATGVVTRYQHDPSNPNTISDDHVLTVHERAGEPDVIWVGMYGGGLDRLDVRTQTVSHYTEADGLANNAIYGILEDADGHLWMSTNGGLSRFDPESETFTNYDGSSGLQSREFNGGAYAASARGEMFFGGPNGVNAFFPHQIAGNPNPPQIVVNDVQVIEGRAEARSLPLDSDAIILQHFEKDLRFDYLGLHFTHPERNRYRYKLEGYDDEWRDAGLSRTATYTNLDPGKYTFRVLAANSDGVWNEEGAAVSLTILPPWWRTWWAYALYALLFAAGVFGVDRVQRYRLIHREREAAKIRMNRFRAEAAEARARALQAEYERQTQELEGARQLQLSMLPHAVPDHPAVDMAASMQTATEVGGDYYDFDVAPDGTLTIAVGDATGHGMKAGTMVTAVKGILNVLHGEDDLEAVLRRSTTALKRMQLPRLYMTLVLARLRGQILELIGAGMPPALVYRAARRTVEQVPLKGMPLGSFPDFPYRTLRLALDPGDTIVFMSDGFPELFNAQGEMLGYDGAVRVFEEVASRNPQEILAHFEQTSRAWTGGNAPDDDMTFVVLTMKNGHTNGHTG